MAGVHERSISRFALTARSAVGESTTSSRCGSNVPVGREPIRRLRELRVLRVRSVSLREIAAGAVCNTVPRRASTNRSNICPSKGTLPMTRMTRRFMIGAAALAAAGLSLFAQSPRPAEQRPVRAAKAPGRPIKVLFLAPEEQTPHGPVKMITAIAPVLARRGIQLTYATKLEAIEPARLAYYDAVVVYGDKLALTPAQEKAVTD